MSKGRETRRYVGDDDWNYEQSKATVRELGKETEQRQQTVVLCASHTFFSHSLKCISHKNKDLSFLALIRELKTSVLRKTTRTTTMSAFPNHDKKKRRKQEATD